MKDILNLLVYEFNSHFKSKLDQKKILKVNKNNFSQWDSLEHLKFLLRIEKKFKFKFLTQEIINIHSFKEIYKILKTKL
jgi:acyl carrier protein